MQNAIVCLIALVALPGILKAQVFPNAAKADEKAPPEITGIGIPPLKITPKGAVAASTAQSTGSPSKEVLSMCDDYFKQTGKRLDACK